MRLLLAPILAAVVTFASFPAPVVADENAGANQLLLEAVTRWNMATALDNADMDALEAQVALLEEVQAALARIFDDHPGSDLAVKLIIGEAVGPISLTGAETALSEARGRLTEARCLNAPQRACLLDMALELHAGSRIIRRRPGR